MSSTTNTSHHVLHQTFVSLPAERDQATPFVRVFRALVVTALLGVSVALLPAARSGTAVAVSTWHVAPWGDDAAAGTRDQPFQTVQRAVRRATGHDVVVLRGGLYRESVLVADKAVHIRSAPGERAVFDGARSVVHWRRDGDHWVSDHWTQQFSRERAGESVDPSNVAAGHPDQVFLDETPLHQVLDRDEIAPGTFFHDVDADQLWIGDDPGRRRVSASTLKWGFHFKDADGSTLSDVTVRRYATEASNMAAIRAHGDDLVFSGVIVEQNARIGLSAIGRDIVLRDSDFSDNGHLGIDGHLVDGFILERAAVTGNNRAGFDPFHSGGGLKLTRSTGITVRESDVSFNGGPGIWTDLDVDGVTLLRNLVEGNDRAGIELELSTRINVLGNVALDNGEAGIWVIESRDAQILHNASFGNQNAIEIEEGPRREVADIRVFNNTLGRAADGAVALLDVNDWTEERSADDMRVRIDDNAYWVPDDSGTERLSRWGRWPRSPGVSETLDRHRLVTGQAANSIVSFADTNPYVRSAENFDYRAPDSMQRGVPVTGSAAEALGVPDGGRLRIGPPVAVTRR